MKQIEKITPYNIAYSQWRGKCELEAYYLAAKIASVDTEVLRTPPLAICVPLYAMRNQH
jgi:hypothetical protein